MKKLDYETKTKIRQLLSLKVFTVPINKNRIASGRLMRFDWKRNREGLCYDRNDWTTYRAIELDNLYASKFNLIDERG